MRFDPIGFIFFFFFFIESVLFPFSLKRWDFEVFFLYCFADKDRELGEAQAEIKALKLSERLREKAVEEVGCFGFLGLVLIVSERLVAHWKSLSLFFFFFLVFRLQ